MLDEVGTKTGSFLGVIGDVRRILNILSFPRRLQLAFLLAMQIVAGLLEIVSLGALIPFISALDNIDSLKSNGHWSIVADYFGVESNKDAIIFVSFIFVVVYIFVSIFKYFIIWLQSRIVIWFSVDIIGYFYTQILRRDFEYHIQTNSGVLINRIFSDVTGVIGCLNNILTILAQLFSILAISFALFIIDVWATTMVIAVVSVCYISVVQINRDLIVGWGKVVSDQRARALCSIQAGLGSIRDVILGGKQDRFVEDYIKADQVFRRASANVQVLSVLPRYLMEVLGVAVLVSVTVIYVALSDNERSSLVLVGAFAAASIRLLPAAQSIYASYAVLQNAQVPVKRAFDLVIATDTAKLPGRGEAADRLSGGILLEDIWFKYANANGDEKNEDEWNIKGVSIRLPENQTVALVGETGCGKSTISDIALGLLVPTKGRLTWNEKDIQELGVENWFDNAACVPQFPYIVDDTVLANIAFGESTSEYEVAGIQEACKAARIHDVIVELPDGYNTLLGENGARLSGGQKQRIALARALYRKTPFLVLDEATSALDTQTEQSVLQTLNSLIGQKTILIVAHRMETIKTADLIYVLKAGEVIASGNYEDLIKNSPAFGKLVFAS